MSTDPGHYLKGFPWHPQRGIETITNVVSGDVEHGDSLGSSGVIHPLEMRRAVDDGWERHEPSLKTKNRRGLWQAKRFVTP